MPSHEVAETAPYEQTVALGGRSALRTAALGGLVLAMGGTVVWLVSPEPWPLQLGAAMVFVPVLGLGGFIVALAAMFHLRRATWQLRVDDIAVTLAMCAANGRAFKQERLALGDLEGLVWIEGDDDLSPGVRLRARTGRDLVVPADAFDVAALWAELRRRLPKTPVEGR